MKIYMVSLFHRATINQQHRAFAHTTQHYYNTNKMRHKLERGPMSNVMAALPNIGGALCSTQQSLADAHY